MVRKVNHRHIWDTPSTSKSGEDGGEEDIVINAEAYQEETSNDINVTFDVTDTETHLVREEIEPIEVEAVDVELEIDPNDEILQESSAEENDDEELVLCDTEDISESEESD